MTSAPPGRPYASPYLAGVGVGLALLASFVVLGQGLGASGAFAAAATTAVAAVAPAHAAASPAWRPELELLAGGLLSDWIVLEILGVGIGAFLSAWAAGRLRAETVRGDGMSPNARLAFALMGGVLMGMGARWARGCTSGQALSGGALLSVGSWLFVACAFASGYLAAPLARRLWR